MELYIRTASEEDAAALLEIYAPYVEHTAITFEYVVPTVEEFGSRIKRILKKYPYLVAERNGIIVGYTYADVFKGRAAYDWAVETTIYVKQDQKKTGVGKALYEVLEKTLAKQHILNLNACIAYCSEEDEYLTKNSVQFHEHMGYKMAGEFHQCGYKFHRWYHMVWMEKLIGEHVENPPAVRAFPEIGFTTEKV